MSQMIKTKALYDDLAKELGVTELPIDSNGGVELTVGERTKVILFSENDRTLLVVSPIAALPTDPGFGLMAWLFRKNLYDSALAPFCIATDADANLILWGRFASAELNGSKLAGLIDAVASESEAIRTEIEES